MTKRTLLLALFFFSFAFISCRKTEQQEYPKLPSLNVTMTPMQLDSIINDYNNKVSAFAVLIDSDGDTLFQDYLTTPPIVSVHTSFTTGHIITARPNRLLQRRSIIPKVH